jgi:hypothetical protein
MNRKLTVVLLIPYPFESELKKEAINLHKKYGEYSLKEYPDKEKYYDVPHINLFEMGECIDNKEGICKKLSMIANKFPSFQVESEGVVLFDTPNSSHVVLKIKNNPTLQKLHEVIVRELKEFSAKEYEFILDKYNPHCSKILYLPKDIAEQAIKDVEIRELKFNASEIGIKVKQFDNYARIDRSYRLS